MMLAVAMGANMETWSWTPFVNELDPDKVIDLWLSYEHRSSNEGFLAGFVGVLDIRATASAVAAQKAAKASGEDFNPAQYQALWEARMKAHGGELMSDAHTRCESAIASLGNAFVGNSLRRWLDFSRWHGQPDSFLVPLVYAECRGALKGVFGSVGAAETALTGKLEQMRKVGTVSESRAS